MLGEKLRQVPRNKSGVYCLYDLDLKPAYIGRTSDIRGRLRQHFVRQDSSVVSYGRLDIWDISHIDWWRTDQHRAAEQLLLSYFEPYLNFESLSEVDATQLDVDPESPTATVELISEEERTFRSEPYTRSKQKLEHLSRMLDKIKLAGHSDDTKRTLYEHLEIFEENLEAFLDLDSKRSN